MEERAGGERRAKAGRKMGSVESKGEEDGEGRQERRRGRGASLPSAPQNKIFRGDES